MDNDVTMSDGQETNYPAPGSAPSTPYPALDQSGSTGSQRRVSLPATYFPPATGKIAPSMAETARGYLSLAQYFEIGRAPDHSLQAQSQPDRDQDDNENGNEDNDGGDDEEEEEQQPTGSSRLPTSVEPYFPPAPEPEEVWTSLPGTHHLPDDDYLEAQNRVAWPQRLDSSTNHSAGNSPMRGKRGRPRGRSSGRKGWKWALKGTDHEDMFQSPRITAEASGTRRRGRGSRANRGGIPRGRPRGTTAGGRAVPVDPGEAFKALQAKATAAFLDNDLDKALEFSLQAVTENPEVSAAHFLIDQVMTAQGRHEDAMQAHWMAVITSRNAESWLQHGERLLELAGDDKSKGDFDAAFRCFSEALKLDKNNIEIRSKKVDLFVDMKAYTHAFRECRAILKLKPGDTDMLWKLAELLKLTKNSKHSRQTREERGFRTIDAYRAAFHSWRGEDVFGDVEMQWAHLDVYIDLLEEMGTPPNDCIRELKQIARWLLGRSHEIFWDSLNDDREYDLTPERRMQTDFWRGRLFTLDEARYGNGLPVWMRAKIGYMRARMGFLYREEALMHLSALLLQPAAAEDNPETFMLAAERLSGLYWYQDAVKFYEAAKNGEHADGTRFFVGMGRCYKKLERIDDAEKAFQSAISLNDHKMDARIELARLYAETGRKDDAAKVAHAISRIGRESIQRSEKTLITRHLARPLIPASKNRGPMTVSSAVLKHLPNQRFNPDGEARQDTTEDFPAGKDDVDDEDGGSDDETESVPGSLGQASSVPAKKAGKKGIMAYEEQMQLLRQQRARVQRSHEMVKKLWPFIDTESESNEEVARQWMEHAGAMANEFTSTKAFYPSIRSDRFAGLLTGRNASTKQVIAEMESLMKQMRDVSMENGDESETIPSTDDITSGDFHDISFQEWHRIMSDLALQHARFADQEKCNSVIDALTRGNVFRHDFALYNTTLALSIYCAIVFNDRELFLETSRQYLHQSDYRSGMAYQVFAAASSIGYGETPFDYDGSKMQQWTHKQVKVHDILIMDPEMRDKWEWGTVGNEGKEQRHNRLGKVDDGLIPGLLTAYAHIVTSKRRVHSATSLSYLFRALALQPDEVVVNLSIAINYIIDGLKRSDPESVGLDRQKTIQEGLGFFWRYYNARVATGQKCHLQEAEYNAARIWDLLGWTRLAAKGYEKVLKLSLQVREEAERQGEEAEDVASEAAFALQRDLHRG